MTMSAGVCVRVLGTVEYEGFLAHMMRLDSETRALRFAAGVDDHFVMSHCLGRILRSGFIVGAFADDCLVGACEVDADDDKAVAELAFSVEKPFRGTGIGKALMRTAIDAARAAGIGALRIDAAGSPAMIRIAALAGFTASRDGVLTCQLRQPTTADTVPAAGSPWIRRLLRLRAA